MPSTIIDQISQLDSFAKPRDDYRTKTFFGGLLTILSGGLILLLIASEFSQYKKVIWKPELIVDTERKEKVNIEIDITFPKVPCFALTLDVMDEANDYQNNLSNSVKKISHDSNGNEIGEYIEPDPHHPEDYCGSCYDAQVRNPDGSNMCCNTCSSVFAAYEHLNLEIPKMEDIEQCREEDWPAKIRDHSKEGCRVKGKFQVNKVSGNFHFAPGKSFDVQNYHLHDVRFLEGLKLDFSHKIDYLAFGEYHEKIVNPLDKTENISEMSDNSFKYHIKLVAAEFKSLDGRIINTNQYAVTQSDGDTKGLRSAFPSVFFEYEISPMILIYTEYKRPFSSFLTGLCAIIGGVYTIAAIIDSIVHSAQRRVTKKSNLGKIN